MDFKKIAYWGTTGLLCLLFTWSALMYFFMHEIAAEAFTTLGYPTHIIYPLAIAKLLAVVAILSKKSQVLKEWAYAGLFYDLVLAVLAHALTDGQFYGALLGLILLVPSYLLDKKLFK